jgi:hypothetical protein
VKFKALSGSIDRAGGRVVNGRRSQLAEANLKVTSGDWHELRVEATGNKITCYYDGNKKMEATDDTFKDAGKVGPWSDSLYTQQSRA